ncbi:hypothetical protein GP486_002996 [Trichoglossum hirsutum]|uniref:Uncharacterized protein n=1 Tax=Trichoglossum hirsutum TaxID=265104 RepID=A0A9P8RRL1_9PEZI|nr:hypothetical protein GP486_002996 [Trichoglossum hirsutum]
MAEATSPNPDPEYQGGIYTASGLLDSPQVGPGEHKQFLPPSPSTSIESGDNPLDIDNDPEPFYKSLDKNFSLGPWDPDARAYKPSESEEIGNNRAIYSFVVRRQLGKPDTTINHDVDIKSRELQNIVGWALEEAMSSTFKEHDLTVDLIGLCNVFSRLETSLEHLKTLVEFLKQLLEIEHRQCTPTYSPDLHPENVVDPQFLFVLDRDTGNEEEN